ncbi:MAG TPA: glycosyltransferase family 39 protein [Chitinivibrionales bacterium]|nr:glycosyltransferase family 39 protein [Chitinivibrionales bacterium]
MEYLSTRTKVLIAGLAALVYCAGLFVTVMDIDAAQYASMSCQIAAGKDFWTALLKPAGYLDKPPLLFFLSAVSFKVLGVSTVAYKLPSLLITILGFYATYRLGKLLYGRRLGVLSAVILCSSEGIIFFTNDVRTDAILTGAVVFSLWQIAEFIQTGRAGFFLGGCIGIALAMLAKGPIGLMVPVLAIGSYLAGKRNFGMFFKWYWPVGGLIVLVLISPMLWGLYAQYGWHGIKFYFWTQSFGRITGQSSWHDTSGYFFFVHTFLWAFLPWMLLAYYSIGDHAVTLIKSRFNPAHGNDMLLLGGTVFPFVALSCSHYKLPHYIFVIFPLVAILTAKAVFELVEQERAGKTRTVFIHTQRVVCILTWVFALVCLTVFFPCKNPIVWILVAPAAIATFYFLSRNKPPFVRLVVPSVLAIFGLNLVINVHFFPELMKFQGGSNAAAIIRSNSVAPERLYCFGAHDYSIDFSMRSKVPVLDSAGVVAALRNNDVWIYTERPGYRSILEMGYTPAAVDSFPNVHVAKVTAKFLLFWSRPAVTGRQYLLHFIPKAAISAIDVSAGT